MNDDDWNKTAYMQFSRLTNGHDGYVRVRISTICDLLDHSRLHGNAVNAYIKEALDSYKESATPAKEE